MRIQLRIRNGEQSFQGLCLLRVFNQIPNLSDTNVRVNVYRPDAAAAQNDLSPFVCLECERGTNEAAFSENDSRSSSRRGPEKLSATCQNLRNPSVSSTDSPPGPVNIALA